MSNTWLIEANLEQIFHSIVTAINTRDFNENSPAWQNLALDFTHESDGPGPTGTGRSGKTRGPAAYMDSLRVLTTTCPNYRQHVKKTCVSVYPTAAFAEACFDMDVHGLFPDVTRPHVAHVEFRFQENKWICTLVEEVSGHAIADGVTGELLWPPRLGEK